MTFAKKIFIYVFLSTALIISGMSATSLLWISNQHLRSAIHSETELATLAALKSEDYILRNDRVELLRFYRSILEVNPYVEYVFAEKQGEILVHSFEKGVPKGLLNLGPVEKPLKADITPIENNQNDIVYHLRIGIGDPVHSVLHFGLSDQKIRSTLHPLRNLMLLAGGMMLVVIPLALAWFITRQVSGPLKTLSDGVTRIGSGELHHRLDLATGDEIEQLGKDINTMAENLEQLRNGLEQEIKERIQAQGDLAEQTELLNNILNQMPHNIFWKDKQLVYLGCNKAFAATTGLDSPESIVGKTDEDLPLGKKEVEAFRQTDQKVLGTASPIYEIEEKLTLTNGEKKTIVTSKIPLKNQAGKIFGLLGIFYDITERKKLEDTIKQTQKMEAIGTLAGGIAHDFNNILGSIIGYAELAVEDSPPDSPAQNHLTQVLKSANRAKDLVRQILAFSRKSQEERKPILLSTIVKEEAKMLRSTIPTTIEIRQNIDPQAGMVNADATQMHQIVMNLCTNAAHAMQEHGGVLDISLTLVVLHKKNIKTYHNVSPGPYVQLKISDTGPGIDSRIIHRIFEPFFTTKEKGKGTGMGLAVVHGIVKDHGGDIVVQSQLGKGSEFTVLLPQVVSQSRKAKDDHYELPTGTEHVLLIDDEEMLLNLGKKMLISLGYKVKTVNSSIEALNVFKQSPDQYDLVITDHTMPHMTGFNLARQVLDISPATPVILCTGYSEHVTAEKVEGAGIKALLYKPIARKEIARTIRKVLDAGARSSRVEKKTE